METRSDEVISEPLPGPAAEAAQADRDGYLLTTAIGQRIDLLRHLLDFSRQIILVVGDEGSGKTSLLHHLLATAADNWRLAKINADPMCDSEALMKRLGADFELRFSDDAAAQRRVEEFEQFVAASRRAALVPVVLVDDAHLLPADSLLLLQQLAHTESEAPNLRIALFCDSRISRVLGSPQLHSLRDSLTHTVELAPFTLEDTARYLASHWPAADPDSSPILDEQYVREVHAASGGIPGRINALVRTSLEAPGGTVEAQMPRPTARQIGLLAAGVGVAALLTAGVWWLMPGGKPEPRIEAPAVASSGPAPTAIVEPVPIPLPAESPPRTATTVPPVTPPAISPPAPTPTASPTAAAPPAATTSSDINPEGGSEYSHSTSAEAPVTAPAPVPAQPVAPPSESAPSAQPPQAVAAKPPAPAPVPSKEKPRQEKSVSETRPPEKPAGANAWLQRQPAGNYVVQLYATYQRSSASQFITENGLGPKANIIATLRDNKTWYVVVYGSYGDRPRARAAIDTLPDAVQRLNPWVRKVADLKALQADR